MPLVGACDKKIAAFSGILHAFHFILLMSVIVKTHLKLIGMDMAKQALLRMGRQFHLSQTVQMRYSQRRKVGQLPLFLQFRFGHIGSPLV